MQAAECPEDIHLCRCPIIVKPCSTEHAQALIYLGLHYQHNKPVPEEASSHEKPSQVSKPDKPLPIRRHILCNAVPNHWPTSWPVVVLQQQRGSTWISSLMPNASLLKAGTSFRAYTYPSCSSAFSCKLCLSCCQGFFSLIKLLLSFLQVLRSSVSFCLHRQESFVLPELCLPNAY